MPTTQTFKEVVNAPIVVKRGDSTATLSWSLVDPNFPDGLAGATIKASIKLKIDPDIAIKTFSTENNGFTIVDAALGKFTWNSYHCFLAVNVYQYDIQITYPGEIIKTRFQGTYTVVMDWT